jgi:hypothetical protein
MAQSVLPVERQAVLCGCDRTQLLPLSSYSEDRPESLGYFDKTSAFRRKNCLAAAGLDVDTRRRLLITPCRV